MRETLRRAAMLAGLASAAIYAISTTAIAQAPTDAQRAAIRSQCRSDYMAHCASVPPGGVASLQCLQKNMASLAPGCQAAVQAIGGASEAKTETKTETKTDAKTAPAADSRTEKNTEPKNAESKNETNTEPKTEARTEPKTEKTAPGAPAAGKVEPAAAETAAKPAASSAAKTRPATAAQPTATQPSSAQVAAIRSACRSDYPRVCAGVPTGGAQALQCLEKNKAGVSPACRNAVAAAAGGTAAPAGSAPAREAATSPAAPAAAPAAPSTASAVVLRPMRPVEVLFVMRSACRADVRTLCAGVDPGGGRILQCLASNGAALSPDCRSVLSQFAAQ